MNSFLLKVIACISMFIDHIGYLIFNRSSFFNYIGRLAFPIFSFQITEGYNHTKNLKKYLIRLFIFALISQIPFMLFNSFLLDRFAINVMFTLFLGLICIIIFDKYNKLLGIISTVILGFIAEILSFDYGAYGVIIIMIFYIFKNNILLKSIAFVLVTFIKYSLSTLPYGFNVLFNTFTTFNYISLYTLCTCSSIIPIALYNGKKGKDLKYFLYVFYPLHLLIISVLYFLMVN